MSDMPASPAPLSDDDLRETLDLLATAVANISDRVDDQTRVLDRVNKTATEARSARLRGSEANRPGTLRRDCWRDHRWQDRRYPHPGWPDGR
ncbi:hypothetical protein [Tritonibacter mobilis]|uniref:hypothetical protein n=1 Tax=Tritonibacter mobilis TaxID=379347 RepID=UPI000A65BD67|nr:hypothetical protein [Tritonibacter mobilis]